MQLPQPFVRSEPGQGSKTSRLLGAAARRRGYAHFIEPEFGYCGRIEHAGRALFYRTSVLGINPSGSSALARDKGYSYGLLTGAGLPIPPSMTAFAPDFEDFGGIRGAAEARRFAAEIGYPVIVKPNDGSRAFGVARADSPEALERALNACFARREGRVAVVQGFVAGEERRLIAVDGRVVLAYRKRPLILQADGRPVRALLEEARERREAAGRKPFKLDDSRLLQALARQGLDLDAMPERPFQLSDGLTLEFGAGVDVLETEPAMHDLARRALGALGLRFGSVDLIVGEDGPRVLEVNSAPGLTGFASLGYEERAVAVYEEVLEAFFAGP